MAQTIPFLNYPINSSPSGQFKNKCQTTVQNQGIERKRHTEINIKNTSKHSPWSDVSKMLHSRFWADSKRTRPNLKTLTLRYCFRHHSNWRRLQFEAVLNIWRDDRTNKAAGGYGTLGGSLWVPGAKLFMQMQMSNLETNTSRGKMLQCVLTRLALFVFHFFVIPSTVLAALSKQCLYTKRRRR